MPQAPREPPAAEKRKGEHPSPFGHQTDAMTIDDEVTPGGTETSRVDTDAPDAPSRVRRGGRPAKISRESIAEAALLEIDGISMEKVGRRLGVSHSTLYHHVADRSELISLAAERAFAGVDWPAIDEAADAPWREHLVAVAEALIDRLAAVPGLAPALQSLAVPPPVLLTGAEHSVRLLAAVGVAERDAVLAMAIVARLAIDAAIYPSPVEDARGDADPYRHLSRDSARNTLDKLDLVLDGIEYRMGRADESGRTTGRGGGIDGSRPGETVLVAHG